MLHHMEDLIWGALPVTAGVVAPLMSEAGSIALDLETALSLGGSTAGSIIVVVGLRAYRRITEHLALRDELTKVLLKDAVEARQHRANQRDHWRKLEKAVESHGVPEVLSSRVPTEPIELPRQRAQSLR